MISCKNNAALSHSQTDNFPTKVSDATIIKCDIKDIFTTETITNSRVALALGIAWDACGQKLPVEFQYEGYRVELKESGKFSLSISIKNATSEHNFEMRFNTPYEALQYLTAMHTFSKIQELNPHHEIHFATLKDPCDADKSMDEHQAICLNLEDADLKRANLSGMSLKNIHMQNANLTNAKLIGTDLTNANMDAAIFTGADLSGAKLENAELESTDLTNVNLSQTNLSKANLDYATMAATNLYCAKLENATLDYAKMTDVNLNEANLKNASLCSTSILNSTLGGTNLINADLTRIEMKEAALTNVDLTGANLTEVKMVNTRLSNVKMTKACLINANLKGVEATNLNLHKADLYQTEIEQSSLIKANLQEANLNKAIITSSNLNHATLNKSSMFKAAFINNSMIGTDFRDSYLSLADINTENYQQWDPAVMEPTMRFQLDKELNNPTNYAARSVDVLTTGLQLFENSTSTTPENSTVEGGKTDAKKKKPAAVTALDGDHNLLYLHYTLQALAQEADPALQQRALAIYRDKYLTQAKVALHTQSILFEQPDSSLPLLQDGVNMVIMGRSGGALLCSPETYQKMINAEKGAWNNISLCNYDAKNKCSVELAAKEINLRTQLAADYPTLLPAWRKANLGGAFIKLLNGLDLPGNVVARFQDAAEVKALPKDKKIVDVAGKLELAEIFGKFSTPHVAASGAVLNAEHQKQLLSALDLENATPGKQAYALLSVGTIMTRASSSAVFGTPKNTPEPLRLYASALLSAAHQLKPGMIDNNKYQSWQKQLTGDFCSNELSRELVTYLTQNDPDRMLEKLMPEPWQ
jgi:uncharacterized protein YjbI with pentapeptide repeats